jgi:signal transduction histidine kinase
VLSSSQEQAARLVLSTDEALPPARVDEEQLRQVLMNLVNNAEEAMRGGGEVRVVTRRRAAAAGAGYVEIAVQDQGPGIPQDVLKHLFVPFFTTKPRGTGLGLAISQRMVQAMGGQIEVTSQPGEGSTFTILLPAFEPAQVRAPILRPEPELPGSAATGSPAGSRA